jgi:hypothetical protein
MAFKSKYKFKIIKIKCLQKKKLIPKSTNFYKATTQINAKFVRSNVILDNNYTDIIKKKNI